MFFRERNAGEENIRKGFALLPVEAKNGTVWLEKYELFQSWDKRHYRWINEEVHVVRNVPKCKPVELFYGQNDELKKEVKDLLICGKDLSKTLSKNGIDVPNDLLTRFDQAIQRIETVVLLPTL